VAPVFAQQQFGEIGDLKFVSGETLRDCRVGYRTFGQAILKFLGQ
jgi:homoserine acetyltransferase